MCFLEIEKRNIMNDLVNQLKLFTTDRLFYLLGLIFRPIIKTRSHFSPQYSFCGNFHISLYRYSFSYLPLFKVKPLLSKNVPASKTTSVKISNHLD